MLRSEWHPFRLQVNINTGRITLAEMGFGDGSVGLFLGDKSVWIYFSRWLMPPNPFIFHTDVMFHSICRIEEVQLVANTSHNYCQNPAVNKL